MYWKLLAECFTHIILFWDHKYPVFQSAKMFIKVKDSPKYVQLEVVWVRHQHWAF